MWTPASRIDQKFWLQLIEEYKSHRLLWDQDDKFYNERRKRNDAYDELLKLTRAVFPNVDVAFVKHRLYSFRTCYKRELKKVRAAKANGTTYEPNLFYFNALRFLDPPDDFEELNGNWRNNSSEDDDPVNSVKVTNQAEPDYEPEPEQVPEPEQEPEPQPRSKSQIEKVKRTPLKRKCRQRRKVQKIRDQEEKLVEIDEMDNSLDTFASSKRKLSNDYDDDFSMFGERIATHLRKMDEEQSLIAEKIISEVCINGRLNALTMLSYVNIDPSLSQDSTFIHQTIKHKSPSRKEEIYDDEIDLEYL